MLSNQDDVKYWRGKVKVHEVILIDRSWHYTASFKANGHDGQEWVKIVDSVTHIPLRYATVGAAALEAKRCWTNDHANDPIKVRKVWP